MLCSAQRKESIRHFASRGALDIEGLGDNTVDFLVDLDVLKSPLDLYHLTSDELATFERISEPEPERISNAQKRIDKFAFEQYVLSLEIPHLKKNKLTTFSSNFSPISKLAVASEEEISNVLSDIAQDDAKEFVPFCRKRSKIATI